MSSRALTKRALERWSHVPHSKQQELIAELKSRPPGSAAIELDEISSDWQSGRVFGQIAKGRVVSFGFGSGMSDNTKRYLMLSDIPKS